MKKGLIIILVFIMVNNSSNAQTKLYCSYLNNVDKHYNYILKNINKKILFKDECSLQLIDSIFFKYQRTNNYKYLKLLDKFSRISDGYVSEHIDDLVEFLTINNTDSFLKFFCNKYNGTNFGLGRYFINILSVARINSIFYLKVEEWVSKNKTKCSSDFLLKVDKIKNKNLSLRLQVISH